MKTLRLGVIGLGIGRRHLQSLARMDEVEIAAIADQDATRREDAVATFGARGFEDGATLLAEADLDAVSICTPPASHAELTETAARRGIHVLCEKPMAPTLKDCDRMIQVCNDAGVTLMIAQKKRFHPFVQRLKELAETDLGPVRWAVVKYALGRVEMEWFWREEDGGGPLQENSVHAVDTLRYLMGEVSLVMATGGTLFMPHRAPQLDTASVALQFENGGIAALGLGMASEWHMADEHFFFACEGGEAGFSGRFDAPTRWRLALRSSPDAREEFETEPDDCFDREIAHFLECVRTGQPPLVTGESARGSVAVTLAIKESIRRQAPVRLSGAS